MNSEALEARLDDLRQVCFAPGDAYSAGEWCEAANEGVQIALALLAALVVAREREQRATDALKEIARTGPVFDAKGTWSKRVCEIARAALGDEPAAAHPMIVREYPKHDDRAREALVLLRQFYELQQGPQSLVHADGPLVNKITAALAELDEPAADEMTTEEIARAQAIGPPDFLLAAAADEPAHKRPASSDGMGRTPQGGRATQDPEIGASSPAAADEPGETP